jgi:hypothetical protein
MRIIKNQQGITTSTVIGFIVILVIIGFTGWRVMEANKAIDENKVVTNQPIKSANTESTQKDTAYKIPEGYLAYENKTYGFTFAYPEEYGKITKQSKYFDDQVSEVPGLNEYSKTGEFMNTPSKGINGSFSLLAYKSLNQALTARKYGPMVKVDGDKLVVTSVNPSDVNKQKVGDEYKDFGGSVVKVRKAEDLKLFKLVGGDEGTTFMTLVIVADERVYELRLPNFSDGSYGGGDVVDDTMYNQLVNNVIDSVRSL